MNWNYRVIKFNRDGEEVYEIHEVYYNDEQVPIAYTENPVALSYDSYEALVNSFKRFEKASSLGILTEEDFK